MALTKASVLKHNLPVQPGLCFLGALFRSSWQDMLLLKLLKASPRVSETLDDVH